jgi:Holliday junction DNA helicase RuvA
MISYLKGKLIDKGPTRALVDVGGIGCDAQISLSTYEDLQKSGEEVTLLTFLAIRDDRMELYGFSTPEERELFLFLVSVSGIGYRSALSILSNTSINNFKSAVVREDKNFLSSIQGIGKKTAERIILELRDRFGKEAKELPGHMEEALQALLTLGFKRDEAGKALEKISPDGKPLEEIIREALKNL